MKEPLLITYPTNVTYLTSYTGTNGFAIFTNKKIYLLTDARYLTAAKKLASQKSRNAQPKFNKIPLEVINISDGLTKEISKIIKAHKYKSLYFEEKHLNVGFYKHLSLELKPIKLKPTLDLVEIHRAEKTPAELKNIAKAQEITDQVFKTLKKELKPGRTEKQIAWQIEILLRKYGAEENSFPSIVAFEEHSAIPHHQPTDKKLTKGEVVLIDMGLKFKRYCSDMTRTLFTKPPNREQEKVYQTVLAAQKKGIENIKPGRMCKNSDLSARKIIQKAGYAEYFGHSYGHGVGLDIHEAPTLSTKSPDKFKENIVVTAEPGIYLPGKFGIRIEDMLIVRKNSAKNLTKSPKELKDSIIKI